MDWQQHPFVVFPMVMLMHRQTHIHTQTHKSPSVSIQHQRKQKKARARESNLKSRQKKRQRNITQRKRPACPPKLCQPPIPLCSTHHRPGLPLAVSQKKWLKRSLVLKLLNMFAQWEHGAPGLQTHDCGREPLIPRHMTYSPIIPSGSLSTWSKWAKSQCVWTVGRALKAKDGWKV